MKLTYLENVTTLNFTAEKCVGCGRCTEVCPHGVFDIDIIDKKVLITDKNLCMECGACVMNCPAGAIEVNAGVGCAAAIIYSWFTGKEPTCDCNYSGGNGEKTGKCC